MAEGHDADDGLFGLVRETSGHRLLMVSRWLEKIPGAQAKRVLDDQTVSLIAQKAAETAVSLNHPGLEQRIAGALRSLRVEAKEEQFARLLAALRSIFDSGALSQEGLDDSVLPTLMQANAYRGQEAHGFVGEGMNNAERLYAAITAMEALCYLLTIADLPMSEAGRRRALSSRLVRSFRYAQLSARANATV